MNNYNIKLVQKKETKNIRDVRKQIEVTKKNSKEITLDDVKLIYKDLLEKGVNANKISIVGLNAERLTTIKSFDEADVFDEFDEEYLENKGEDIRDKLTKYYRLEFIIY